MLVCFLIIGRKEADMIVHQADFSKGNVYKLVLRVSMPLIVAELVNLLYNMVDRIYIGHIPEVGSTALTGLGLCFPVISLISAFAKLFGSNGGAPLSAMARGRGDDRRRRWISAHPSGIAPRQCGHPPGPPSWS